jgi:hypothetical protein
MFNGMAYITSKIHDLKVGSSTEQVLFVAKQASQTYLDMITSTAEQAIQN